MVGVPPGPWSFHVGHDYTEFFDAADNSIFTVFFAMPEPMARLIAASPELFAAGQRVDELVDSLWDSVPWGKTCNLNVRLLNEAPMELKAALSKVKGGGA